MKDWLSNIPHCEKYLREISCIQIQNSIANKSMEKSLFGPYRKVSSVNQVLFIAEHYDSLYAKLAKEAIQKEREELVRTKHR